MEYLGAPLSQAHCVIWEHELIVFAAHAVVNPAFQCVLPSKQKVYRKVHVLPGQRPLSNFSFSFNPRDRCFLIEIYFFSKTKVYLCIFLFYYCFLNKFIYLFIFGCIGSSLLCVDFSLVPESGSYSSLQCAGFSLQWLLLLQSMGSRHVGFSSCGTQAQ